MNVSIVYGNKIEYSFFKCYSSILHTSVIESKVVTETVQW